MRFLHGVIMEYLIIYMLFVITSITLMGYFENPNLSTFRTDQIKNIEISYLADYDQCMIDLDDAKERLEIKKSLCPDVKCDYGKGQYFLGMLWTIGGIILILSGTHFHNRVSKKSDALKEEKRQLRLERLNNKVKK